MNSLSIVAASFGCLQTTLAHEAPADYAAFNTNKQDEHHYHRIRQAQLDLWLHGAFDTSPTVEDGDDMATIATGLEMQAARAPLRHGPVREVRRRLLQSEASIENTNGWQSLMEQVLNMRGGDGTVKEDHASSLENKLAELSVKFGKPFMDAIEQNKAEHAADCKRSCELFYCADESSAIQWDSDMHVDTSFASYSFGSVPPEDFSDKFK